MTFCRPWDPFGVVSQFHRYDEAHDLEQSMTGSQSRRSVAGCHHERRTYSLCEDGVSSEGRSDTSGENLHQRDRLEKYLSSRTIPSPAYFRPHLPMGKPGTPSEACSMRCCEDCWWARTSSGSVPLMRASPPSVLQTCRCSSIAGNLLLRIPATVRRKRRVDLEV